MPSNHPIQTRNRRADNRKMPARAGSLRRPLGNVPGNGLEAPGYTLDQLSQVCDHDYSFGYCPQGCVRLVFIEHILAERQRKLYELGHRHRAKNDRVDKVSLIRAYQAVHNAEKYPWGVPDNVLTAEKVTFLLS